MVELIWDEKFKKAYKKWVHQHPDLKDQFAKKIILLKKRAVSSLTKDTHPERSPERTLVFQDYVRATARL